MFTLTRHFPNDFSVSNASYSFGHLLSAFRSSTLDLTRKDGEKAPRCSSGQHSEVPMCNGGKTNPDATLAEKRQTLPARRPYGWL